MAQDSKISWTKSTFNPFIGCTKVGPGCDNCYAEATDARGIFGKTMHWGPGVPRMRTSASNWAQVRKWNRQAPETEFAGVKGYWPVFTASLADIFDNEIPEDWRADYWALVRECSNLTFLIVTKRIGNAKRMLPADWGDGYPNVVLLATVVNQEEADRDIPKLMATPAFARGLSMEPLLGAVDLEAACDPVERVFCSGSWGDMADPQRCALALRYGSVRLLDWVIVGGESGPNARPMHPDWARSLRDQCTDAGVSFHFKQWGAWAPQTNVDFSAWSELNGAFFYKGEWRNYLWWAAADPEGPDGEDHENDVFYLGKKSAGRSLDGVEHDGIPWSAHR